MPRYDFKCRRCGRIREGTMSFEESKQKGLKCSCDGWMERIFSPQGITFQVRWGKPKVRNKVKRTGA